MAYDVEQAEVRVVSPDGSDPIDLSRNPASDIMPRWSPDGNWIAFFSDRDGAYDLYMMRSDGSGTRKVARIDLARDDPFYWMTYGWDAHGVNYTWLPGGKHILFEDQLIDIETALEITTSAPREAVAQLIATAERMCFMMDVVREPHEVRTRVTVNGEVMG